MGSSSTQTARTGLLMVMCAAVLWGIGNVVARSIYDVAETNALSIAFLRLALSVPPLIAMVVWSRGLRGLAVNRRELPWMLVSGALVSSYYASFYASLSYIGVAISTVLALASAPLIVALLSALIAREWPTRRVWLAMACALLGVALVSNVSTGGQQPNLALGAGLAILAGGLFAVNALVGRRLGSADHANPLQTAMIGFAFGAVLMFVVASANGLVLSYPPGGWARMAFLGIVPTALGYGLFFSGVRSASATAASIATLAEPLTSTVLAVLIYREPLGLLTGIGLALLLASMIVLLLRPART
jgi:drug/metabolite transporter, DME family